MALSKILFVALLALAMSAVFSTRTGAVRHFKKRSDLDAIPPVQESGYTVPLIGGWTCQNSRSCTNTLPAPSPDKVLSVLTLARGNLSYSCPPESPTAAPVYISEQTELFNAAPLIQYNPSEDAFHSLVPQLYTYDYAALVNSSLVCIGKIYTHLGQTTVDLVGHQPVVLDVNTTIPAPNPQADSYWAQLLSQAFDWEVYRVETTGGALPVSCTGLAEHFEVGYAAEYWFYHG